MPWATSARGKPFNHPSKSDLMSLSNTPLARNAARATPAPLAARMRGLSDRTVAWLFIGPTMALLLARRSCTLTSMLFHDGEMTFLTLVAAFDGSSLTKPNTGATNERLATNT